MFNEYHKEDKAWMSDCEVQAYTENLEAKRVLRKTVFGITTEHEKVSKWSTNLNSLSRGGKSTVNIYVKKKQK